MKAPRLNFKDSRNSAQMNMLTYQMYLEQLMQLAMVVFKWEGLPSSVDERYLELKLLNQGMILYFKDDVMGEVAIQTTIGGQFSVYDVPIWREAYAANGYHCQRDIDNSVLIYDTIMHTICVPMLEQFALRLEQIQRTIDVNMNGQKMPYIIKSKKSLRQTMLNLLAKWQGYEPFVLADEDLDLGGIEVLATPTPYLIDKLMIYKRQLWNEILTYIGVPANSSEKAERQITNEVNASQGNARTHQLVRLRPRQDAAKQISEMFGHEVTVDVNPDIAELIKAITGESREELTGEE